MKKLNARGFAHHAALAVVVLAVAIFGTYRLVASHAQVPYSNAYSCSTQPLLRAGSTGTCVKYLQTALAATSTSPGLAVDGSFGPNTKLAVQKFQFANKVTNSSCGTSYASCDGIVGSATWPKVVAFNNAQVSSSASVPIVAPVAAPRPVATTAPATATATAPKPVATTAPAPTATPKPVATTAPAPSQTAPAKPTAPTAEPAKPAAEQPRKTVINDPGLCPNKTKTIRPGDRGNCVAQLQSDLRVGIDGVYDTTGATRNAVDAVQRKASLERDGVVGPCTWKAIRGQNLSGCSRDIQPAKPGSTPVVATITCRYTDASGKAKVVQTSRTDRCDELIASGRPVYGVCTVLNRGLFGAFGWVRDTKTIGYISKYQCEHTKDYISFKAYKT